MTTSHPTERPKFHAWLKRRGIGLAEAAGEIGCSAEHVRLICLPFADARRSTPRARIRRAIEAYTAGDVTLLDWDPPQAVAA